MVKLKSLVRFLGLSKRGHVELSHSKKDACVRIIHAGGREELHWDPVLASQLMNKYPGMWVARPQVFRKPLESFLWPDERLDLGEKYYMIPSTTAKKLKRKFRSKRGPLDGKQTGIRSFSPQDEKVSDPSDRETGMRFFARKKGMGKKKPFVPPITRERSVKSIGWEPSLSSVKEVSS